MPRRPATVTQADIARAIRAVRDSGLTVARVVLRGDGYAVETSEAPAPIHSDPQGEIEPKRVVVL